jgi:hypothetical protein
MLPTAAGLLLFPAWLLVLLLELLAQLLLGITVVPTVPLSADPPGTLFVLRNCVTAQSHSVRTYTPCMWLHILYPLLIVLLTEAMTRLCSCGPSSVVVELLESLKMLWASISADSVSDIFCAMVDDGFNWLPSMCGAITPF